MSDLNHEALIHLVAESNRQVPIDPSNPAVAALVEKLQAAQIEVSQSAQFAEQKAIAVQAALAMVIPFATENRDLDENDPLVCPLVSALRQSRTEFNQAMATTVQRLQAVIDIIACIETTARNSCIRFN